MTQYDGTFYPRYEAEGVFPISGVSLRSIHQRLIPGHAKSRTPKSSSPTNASHEPGVNGVTSARIPIMIRQTPAIFFQIERLIERIIAFGHARNTSSALQARWGTLAYMTTQIRRFFVSAIMAIVVAAVPLTFSFAYSHPDERPRNDPPNYQLYWCGTYYSYSPCYTYSYPYYDYSYYYSDPYYSWYSSYYSYNWNYNYNYNNGWYW